MQENLGEAVDALVELLAIPARPGYPSGGTPV